MFDSWINWRELAWHRPCGVAPCPERAEVVDRAEGIRVAVATRLTIHLRAPPCCSPAQRVLQTTCAGLQRCNWSCNHSSSTRCTSALVPHFAEGAWPPHFCRGRLAAWPAGSACPPEPLGPVRGACRYRGLVSNLLFSYFIGGYRIIIG